MKPFLDKLLTYSLTPISWLYGAGVYVRNKLYDSKILKETEFEIPVISVGNINVGGTGKTPHVEYIVERLSDRYNIAVLSRGYKRKTSGFVLANRNSTPEQIGDEPYQIYHKFQDKIIVAVSESRTKGIEQITKIFPDVNLIILDDAFQHRSVKPLLSILLIDHNKPLEKDKLLPLGRLREQPSGIYRADMIVVTKCPDFMNPIDYRVIANELELLSFQKLFFSSIGYRDLRPVFENECNFDLQLNYLTENDTILILTGIANPRKFIRYFKKFNCKVRIMRFPDHHSFSKKDINEVERYFKSMSGKRKYIVTTEKDAVRLLHNPYFPYNLKSRTFYLPIHISMHYGIEGEDIVNSIEKEVERKLRTNIKNRNNYDNKD